MNLDYFKMEFVLTVQKSAILHFNVVLFCFVRPDWPACHGTYQWGWSPVGVIFSSRTNAINNSATFSSSNMVSISNWIKRQVYSLISVLAFNFTIYYLPELVIPAPFATFLGKYLLIHKCILFIHLNLEHLCNQNYNFDTRSIIEDIGLVLDEYYESQWFQKVNQERAISGQGRNKLRKYRQHKTEFKAEDYLIKVMNRNHRSALAKFRAGVAPFRLETGWYEGLEVDDRICPICKNWNWNRRTCHYQMSILQCFQRYFI